MLIFCKLGKKSRELNGISIRALLQTLQECQKNLEKMLVDAVILSNIIERGED